MVSINSAILNYDWIQVTMGVFINKSGGLNVFPRTRVDFTGNQELGTPGRNYVAISKNPSGPV